MNVIKPYYIDCLEVYLREKDFNDESEFGRSIVTVWEKIKPRKINIQLNDYQKYYKLRIWKGLTLAEFAIKISSETSINTISRHFVFPKQSYPFTAPTFINQ